VATPLQPAIVLESLIVMVPDPLGLELETDTLTESVWAKFAVSVSLPDGAASVHGFVVLEQVPPDQPVKR
jgi:hypothetical protein